MLSRPEILKAFPDLRRAASQLQAQRFERATALLAARRQAPWDERSFCITTLSGRGPLDTLDAWCRNEPTSPDPWLLRGMQRIEWAWEARGSGRASSVDEEMYRGFHHRLDAAERDLLWAADLLPEDPVPHASLITVAMGLGQGEHHIRHHLQAALERDSEHYAAWSHAVYALTEKWCGTHQEMFDLARQAAARADPGNDLAGVLIFAHIERWLYFSAFAEDPEGGREYLQNPEVRQEVSELFDRTMDVALEMPRRASCTAWNNAAFWFYLIRDAARLKISLKRLGRAVDLETWAYLRQPAKAFAAARKLARSA